MMIYLSRAIQRMQFGPRLRSMRLHHSYELALDDREMHIQPLRYFDDNSGDKQCRDCVHYMGNRLHGKCGMYPFITNIKNNKHFVLDVDIDYESCVEVRKDENKCGKDGKQFEEDT